MRQKIRLIQCLTFQLIVLAGALRTVHAVEVVAGKADVQPEASLKAPAANESSEMAELRKKAKERRRRLIYNNDGNDIFNSRHATPESFLAKRIVPALDTQVDSIFYCTGATTLYDHDTDVAERSDDLHQAMDFSEPLSINRHANMHMLRRAGVDCLSLVTRRVHEAGLEVFWAHRVNDIHDNNTDWLLSKWKRAHPEYLMGTREDAKQYDISHPRFMWSTLDFEKPEVLDYLYRITEEVCQRYDVDGSEIDYFRHPLFFRPNLEYKPATAQQLDILAGFQRRIREMAYREGNRRGRPILVAVHVPLSVEKCLHVGIDVDRWLREDLLDLLVTGSGYQPLSMPMKQMVDLGHAHAVPVYPNISDSGMAQWGNRIEAWRGAASNVWQSGADGIHIFNHFPETPNDPVFMTAGDSQELAKLDKIFGIDNTAEYYGCLEQGIVQSQLLPVTFGRSGQPVEVNLPVGDDLTAAAKAGKLASALLHVQYLARNPNDKVELYLNGTLVALENEDAEKGRVTYRPDQQLYRTGDNTLGFRLTVSRPNRKQVPTVWSAELDVKYR